MMLDAQARIIMLQDENTKMIAAQNKYELLLESKSEIEKELDSAKTELTTTKERLQAAEAEANSYEKSLFGFYRKKK